MTTTDLTSNQTRALRVLYRQELPTIREVAELSGLSSGTARTTVMRLVYLGLAEPCGAAMSGGRCYTITPAGTDLLHRVTAP